MTISSNWIGGSLEDGEWARRMMSRFEEVLGKVATANALGEESTLESFRGQDGFAPALELHD